MTTVISPNLSFLSIVFGGNCAVCCLSAISRGKAALRSVSCVWRKLESCLCLHMSGRVATFAPICLSIQLMLQNYTKVLYLLKNMLVWKRLCDILCVFELLPSVSQSMLKDKEKKKRSGVRKWKCSFIKTVVKFLFMTHSPPSTMRHLRGKWLPHSQFQFYQFTAVYNKSIQRF